MSIKSYSNQENEPKKTGTTGQDERRQTMRAGHDPDIITDGEQVTNRESLKKRLETRGSTKHHQQRTRNRENA